MKTNCWILLGTMLATAAVAQVGTNNLPEIPAPATSAAPAVTAPAPAAAETAKPAEPVKAKPAPKKKRVVKKINEPAVTLVPGPATVTPPNLNVRGQAGLKGEVIAHLKKGDTVTVLSQINLDKHALDKHALDEPAQWAEILLPADVKVWVYSHYVDAATKTITANRLNMRSGPGENFSVLGTLEKGQSINEISKKGNWIEIQPPATAFGFVAAMYLEQTPATVAAATTPPPAEPAMTAPPATVRPTPVMTMTPPPETAMNNTATGMTLGTGPAVEPVIETEPPTNLPPRVVSHEGRVRGSLSPVAPTAYELYDPATRNTINYLYTSSTNLDLSRYDGAEIIVTGEEGLAPRWKETPVLTIQRIYVVDAHPIEAYDKLQSPRASQQKIRGSQAMQRH